VLDDLSTGFWWAGFAEGSGTSFGATWATRRWSKHVIAEHGITEIAHFAAKIVVPDSVTDPLGYYLNNTVKTRSAAGERGARRRQARDLLLDRGRLWRAAGLAGAGGDRAQPDQPLWPLQADERMDAGRRRPAHGLTYVALRYFNVAGADPKGRSGQSTPNAHASDQGREPGGARPARRAEVFGTDYQTPDGTCVRDYIHVTDLARAHLAALDHLRAGGDNLTLNCGYGRGYSVKEVIEAEPQELFRYISHRWWISAAFSRNFQRQTLWVSAGPDPAR
jgi:UDP-glucose 4-epimerase